MLRELLDDLGHPVPLPHPPRRVVSLVPSLTEALASTVPDVLVGATDWCIAPENLDVPRVRGTKNPHLDAIEALRPDLVLANQEENRRLDVERLRGRGVPVWVTRIDTVEEAFTSLRRLFAEVFALDQAPPWLLDAEAEWSPPPPGRPTARVAVPVWRQPWMWVGGQTYAGDLLRRLGWANLAEEFGTRYPKAEPDEVAALDPDLVLLPDEPYPFSTTDGPEAFDPGVTRLVAGRPLFWYGPAMVGARAALLASEFDGGTRTGQGPDW